MFDQSSLRRHAPFLLHICVTSGVARKLIVVTLRETRASHTDAC
jgi:hypothetical protein